jgi:hypothetical protein
VITSPPEKEKLDIPQKSLPALSRIAEALRNTMSKSFRKIAIHKYKTKEALILFTFFKQQ